MTSSSDIDWAEIRSKLPFERTEEQKAKRKDLFMQFDPNENGFLSLAEVCKIFITFNILIIFRTPGILWILVFIDKLFYFRRKKESVTWLIAMHYSNQNAQFIEPSIWQRRLARTPVEKEITFWSLESFAYSYKC